MKRRIAKWPFEQPRNLAVIVSKSVLSGKSWIDTVSHDGDDGGWQFLAADHEGSIDEAAVVSLEEILVADASIEELCDLPEGWTARRESKHAKWLKRLNEQVQG